MSMRACAPPRQNKGQFRPHDMLKPDQLILCIVIAGLSLGGAVLFQQRVKVELSAFEGSISDGGDELSVHTILPYLDVGLAQMSLRLSSGSDALQESPSPNTPYAICSNRWAGLSALGEAAPTRTQVQSLRVCVPRSRPCGFVFLGSDLAGPSSDLQAWCEV
jgi:hypothetical protein